MNWMAWTPVTAGFFITIGVILICMTIWELKSPNVERKGFLPIATTRGDRLFIGLLSSAYIHLMYVGLLEATLIIPLVLCIIWIGGLMRWG
jgi:predicted small integral membrane protein